MTHLPFKQVDVFTGRPFFGNPVRETGLLKEFGPRYTARQGMQVGRDGQVQVRVSADAIEIGGEAVTCVDGKLRLA